MVTWDLNFAVDGQVKLQVIFETEKGAKLDKSGELSNQENVNCILRQCNLQHCLKKHCTRPWTYIRTLTFPWSTDYSIDTDSDTDMGKDAENILETDSLPLLVHDPTGIDQFSSDWSTNNYCNGCLWKFIVKLSQNLHVYM